MNGDEEKERTGVGGEEEGQQGAEGVGGEAEEDQAGQGCIFNTGSQDTGMELERGG